MPRKKKEIIEEEQYKLVVAIVSRGYATEAVNAAKSVGAEGAVIMQGRGVGKTERKFFGLRIEPENEIVMMVVREELALPITKAMYAEIDFKSPGRGLVFVLPVSYVSGLNNYNEEL